jgi:TolB protein
MNVDGSGLTSVTNHPGIDANPVWSPDGTRIAFLSDRDDDNDNGFVDSDIHVVNPDGSGLIKLTNRPAFPRNFAWSPDSRTLVYWERGEDHHNGELYRIDADGSTFQRRTTYHTNGHLTAHNRLQLSEVRWPRAGQTGLC